LAYALVAEHMVHGPCGLYNPKCSCMKNGRCSKNYPKDFHEATTVDESGFAIYKRPNNQRFVIKGGVRLDNRWIVPHKIELLKKYNAHINTKWCNKSIFINYLFKYVTKGPDCSKGFLQNITNGDETPKDEETNTRDEVKESLDTHICPFDSCWRIFRFQIQCHFPPVERMPVHLLDENYVTYTAQDDITQIPSQEFLRRTMLTEWFSANQRHQEARDLSYCDFPSKWWWDEKSRTWEKRHIDGGKIGRAYFVHPSSVSECCCWWLKGLRAMSGYVPTMVLHIPHLKKHAVHGSS
jgi:hypothetical protein